MFYQITGKQKLTGNIIYTSWHSCSDPIALVEKYMRLMNELAYDIIIQYR